MYLLGAAACDARAMRYLLAVVGTAAGALAVLNAYQAVTGRRLGNRPSTRRLVVMRRQSALAALVLGWLSLVVLLLAVYS